MRFRPGRTYSARGVLTIDDRTSCTISHAPRDTGSDADCNPNLSVPNHRQCLHGEMSLNHHAIQVSLTPLPPASWHRHCVHRDDSTRQPFRPRKPWRLPAERSSSRMRRLPRLLSWTSRQSAVPPNSSAFIPIDTRALYSDMEISGMESEELAGAVGCDGMTGVVPKLFCWQHCGLRRRQSAPNAEPTEPTWQCEAGSRARGRGEGQLECRP